MKDAAGQGLRIDLGPVLGNLGIEVSSGEAVDLVGDLVVTPFGDPSGPPARVGHAFEWGIFLDGRSLEDMMRARIPTSIPPLQGLTTHVQWSPPGPVPTLATRIEGSFDVPDPFTCRVEVSVRSGLTMPSPTSLRIDSNWNLDVDRSFCPQRSRQRSR